jgi:hypothetical protein
MPPPDDNDGAKPPSFPRVPVRGDWEALAKGYVEIVAHLAGAHERLESNAAETKGYALAAMGASAAARKDSAEAKIHSAETRAMVEQIVAAMGLKLPHHPAVSTSTTMTRTTETRQRAPSFSELESFAERIEGAAQVIDRATPIHAFPVPGYPIESRKEMNSERVQGVVTEVLEKIEYKELKGARERKKKLFEDVTDETVKKGVLLALGAILAILGSHLLWH